MQIIIRLVLLSSSHIFKQIRLNDHIHTTEIIIGVVQRKLVNNDKKWVQISEKQKETEGSWEISEKVPEWSGILLWQQSKGNTASAKAIGDVHSQIQ